MDAHWGQPHRLQYSVRGPEWGFVIPQGDLDALGDVARRCSSFWNGANSLIAPIRQDGRLPDLAPLEQVRAVEQWFVHPSVGDRAREVATTKLAKSGRLYDSFDHGEANPLVFEAPHEEGTRPALFIPSFSSTSLSRAKTILWGVLADEDLPYWEERFDLMEMDDRDQAAGVLVEGQGEVDATCPLALSTRWMGLITHESPQEWPYVCVVDDTFNAYVRFWNFRARSRTDAAKGLPVIGVPRQLVQSPRVFDGLARWAAVPAGMQRTPDFAVDASPAARKATRLALEAAGFREEAGKKWNTAWGTRVVPRGYQSFVFAPLMVGGRLVRGTSDSALVAIDAEGRIAFDLIPPANFPLRGGEKTRLGLRTLPLPLPASPSLARRIHRDAYAYDGVEIAFAASRRYAFDVRLPGRYEALSDWAADHELKATPTQDSRYAEALLTRLDGDLNVLTDAQRLRVLDVLAPLSRVKLSQQLRKEFEAQGVVLDEAILAARLREVELFVDLRARDAADIGSLIGGNKRSGLAALELLVVAGLVVRGRVTTCPVCNVSDFRRLDELDETIRCRHCRADYTLEVTLKGGQEPVVMYRLDGLVARAMDQDVLPVLLAIRVFTQMFGSSYCWPGVVFEGRGQKAFDVDVLAYNGSLLHACECKRTAGGLTDGQLGELLAFCERMAARPAIAALEGTFAPEQRARVEGRGGVVLERDQLLAAI